MATVMAGLGCGGETSSAPGQGTDAARDLFGTDVAAADGAGDASASEAPAAPDAPLDTPTGNGGSGGSVGTGGGAGTGGRAGTGGVSGSGGTSGASATGGAGGGSDAGTAPGGTSGDAGADRVDTGAGDLFPPGDGGGCSTCATYGTPVMIGRVGSADLSTLSGIATSWKNPGVLFAHNDRAQAQVFALGPTGALLARFALPNAAAVDIEDISVGLCPAGTCIYLADSGGNLSAARVEFSIYRMAEPAIPAGGMAGTTNVTFERFRFAYPDSANHNAEGLLIEPLSGAIYIVTKLAAGQPSAAYALPHPPSPTALNMLRKVADLPVPRAGDQPATATSAHPCGRGFLLATNTAIYEFRIAAGAGFETAFAATPVSVPAPTEPQREAISYRPDGRGYISGGEGASAPLFETSCP